jgi:hypothetical protein
VEHFLQMGTNNPIADDGSFLKSAFFNSSTVLD